MKTYTLHVAGTHCPSCKILIEDIFSEQPLIIKSRVNLKNETVEVQISGEKKN